MYRPQKDKLAEGTTAYFDKSILRGFANHISLRPNVKSDVMRAWLVLTQSYYGRLYYGSVVGRPGRLGGVLNRNVSILKQEIEKTSSWVGGDRQFSPDKIDDMYAALQKEVTKGGAVVDTFLAYYEQIPFVIRLALVYGSITLIGNYLAQTVPAPSNNSFNLGLMQSLKNITGISNMDGLFLGVFKAFSTGGVTWALSGSEQARNRMSLLSPDPDWIQQLLFLTGLSTTAGMLEFDHTLTNIRLAINGFFAAQAYGGNGSEQLLFFTIFINLAALLGIETMKYADLLLSDSVHARYDGKNWRVTHDVTVQGNSSWGPAPRNYPAGTALYI